MLFAWWRTNSRKERPPRSARYINDIGKGALLGSDGGRVTIGKRALTRPSAACSGLRTPQAEGKLVRNLTAGYIDPWVCVPERACRDATGELPRWGSNDHFAVRRAGAPLDQRGRQAASPSSKTGE